MTAPDHTACLDWQGEVPVSRRHADPYFSTSDGLAETSHTFLAGNGLPARFAPGFHIAELGFGTGLNALAAADAWRASGQPGPLRFTSFEAYPIAAHDMARALAPFPLDSAPLVAAWASGARRIELPGLVLNIRIGPAEDSLPAWDEQADAWFLDGFAPARNPDLWSPALMAQVARHTAPGGSFATYTAAGHVRRALSDAGFTVTRARGFGRKRHMSRGRMGGDVPACR